MTEASVEQAFELFSAAAPEGWRVELVEGEICVSPPDNGAHAEIVSELTGLVIDHRDDPALRTYTGIGLRIPGVSGTGRVLPDLTVASKSSFANRDVWQDPSTVLLVAEVTSTSTAARDRDRKILGYARADIPVYLLIDREEGEVLVYSEPSGDDYAKSLKHKLGLTVPLPAPLGFVLDTTEF